MPPIIQMKPMTIVQKRMNYTEANVYGDGLAANHQFSLSLDQSLLIAMKDEGDG